MNDFIDHFSLSDNSYDVFIEYLNKYKFVKVFIDNENVKRNVLNIFENSNYNFQIHHLKFKTKQYLDSLEFSGEDIVVAYGSGALSDAVKYYAAGFSLPVVCVFVEEFFDYNFSKFALIYDGVCSDFYETVSPIAFFVKRQKEFSEMEAYARAKSIEYFDFKFNEILIQNKINDDAKQFFKNTILELRLENFNFVSIVKAFLRLGMAMTFFSTTKFFLFGYFDLFNFLNSKNDVNKCKTATAIISKTYLLAFKYKIKKRDINFNSVINKSAKFLKLPSFCVLKSLKKTTDTNIIKNDIIKLNAYKEYLKNLLLRNLITVKNYKIEEKYIESINYASHFSSRMSLLKLLNDAGMIKV